MPNLTDFFATMKPQTSRQKTGWASAAVIAVSLVAGFEGYASHPYRDTVGTGHPETWCYGETPADGGKVPAYGTLFSKAECTASLQQKLTKVYDPMVRQCIDAKALDGYPYREAALVSFVYNGGQGWLCKPHRHTFTKVAREINAGNYAAGCHAMLAYDTANHRVLKGLVTRRRKEAALCLKGK